MKLKAALAFVFIVILTAVSYTSVQAYSISSTAPYSYPSGTDNQSPLVPASGTLEVDWRGFWQSLPVQNFVQSLQSVTGTLTTLGQIKIPGTQETIYPVGTAQNFFTPIDAWTLSHFGFQSSQFFIVTLSVFSWTLGAAKSLVDWTLGLFK